MIKVQFVGREDPVDLNDDETIIEETMKMAERDVDRVELTETFATALFSALHYWHIKFGATIAVSQELGFDGISTRDAVDAYNFIATNILSKAEMLMPEDDEDEDEFSVSDELALETLESCMDDWVPPGKDSAKLEGAES